MEALVESVKANGIIQPIIVVKHDDIYMIALDKMIEAQKYIVAIIPESFINSNYRQKNLMF